MSIFEYDHEKHMKLIEEDAREDGREEGQDRMLALLKCMENSDEMHLVTKLQDKEFLNEMYAKYNL